MVGCNRQPSRNTISSILVVAWHERADRQELMGRVFLLELEGQCYRCKSCESPLGLAHDVMSRSFSCRQGRAYLFSKVVNVTVGPPEERAMLSGMHTVEDIYCCCCGQSLGWKYVASHDKNQKYKEGKFVLERWRIADDFTEEFSLDARPGSSDVENP